MVINKKAVFVTGADRGVGSALTEAFLEEGWVVFAGQFMPEWEELLGLKQRFLNQLFIVPLDVGSEASVNAAFSTVSGMTEHLDMLINNAGISGSAGDIFDLRDVQKGKTIYSVNCIGALRMTNVFLPLLENGSLKRLCYVSSEAGSISVCHRQDGFIYPMSKAALNMAVRLLFNKLHPKGFSFRLYHPGWVRSYMSGSKSVHGKYEPAETAESAMRYFLNDEKHEDILRLVDNEAVTWPF